MCSWRTDRGEVPSCGGHSHLPMPLSLTTPRLSETNLLVIRGHDKGWHVAETHCERVRLL